MPRVFIVCVLSCFLSLESVAQSQHKIFTAFTRKDGLTDNSITAITQDRFGYTWIGTDQGLNRFDGLNTLTFHSEKRRESLPAESILELQWIDSNNLAVLTRNGLNLLNIQTMKQRSLLVPAGPLKYEDRVNRLRSLLTDPAGNYYIATRTGFYHINARQELVFRYDDYTLHELESSGGGFGSFMGWLDSQHIIVTGQEGIYLYNTRDKKFTRSTGVHPDFQVVGELYRLGARNHTVRQPWPGHFIIFQHENDLAIYVDEKKKQKTISRLPVSPLSGIINWRSGLFVMGDSTLYLSGKNEGLYKLFLDRQTGAITFETMPLFNKRRFNELFIDRDKRWWIGMDDGLAMEKKNSVDTRFMSIPMTVPGFNPLTSLKQVVTDDQFIYAGGTMTGALAVFNKAGGNFEKMIQLDFPGNLDKNVYAVKRSGKDSILCGSKGGLTWYNTRNGRMGVIALPGWDPQRNWMANIFEDSRGHLWLTSNETGGCYRNLPGTWKFQWVKFRQPLVKNLQVVWRVAEDSKGNLWMGGNGLAKFDPRTDSFVTYLDSFPALRFQTKGISALAIDKKDGIWMGSVENGLTHYDEAKKIFTSFTRVDGLPDNNVMALLVTGDYLVITCRTGIARMELKSRKIFNTSNSKELLYNTITGNTLFRDTATGMVYTGAGSQVIGFYPEPGGSSNAAPQLLIENIILRKDSVTWNPPAVIRTSWRHKDLTVTFNAINFDDPEDQQYEYRVTNGRSPGWVSLEKQRRIVFNNLAHGSHTIEVRAFSLNNRWSPVVTSFTLIISPPFWKTAWFYALCLLAVAALIYGLFRYRINQLKKIINVRSRISQDLHDEIGSTLSGIAMYSHLSREQLNNHQTTEVGRSLNTIQQSATEMVSRLSDIVWVVHPGHDTLQKLVQKLEEYATEMAGARGMQVRSDIRDGIAELKLPMETRRNIYLICKEAINNAVKYSQGNELELSVKAWDHTLHFQVKDNGTGFYPNRVKKGNGLENMQKRAAEIGAKLELQSGEGAGSVVSLHCKIT